MRLGVRVPRPPLVGKSKVWLTKRAHENQWTAKKDAVDKLKAKL